MHMYFHIHRYKNAYTEKLRKSTENGCTFPPCKIQQYTKKTKPFCNIKQSKYYIIIYFPSISTYDKFNQFIIILFNLRVRSINPFVQPWPSITDGARKRNITRRWLGRVTKRRPRRKCAHGDSVCRVSNHGDYTFAPAHHLCVLNIFPRSSIETLNPSSLNPRVTILFIRLHTGITFDNQSAVT